MKKHAQFNIVTDFWFEIDKPIDKYLGNYKFDLFHLGNFPHITGLIVPEIVCLMKEIQNYGN